MKDYVVYHNPDVMPPLAEFPPFLALTNKTIADERGSRVWVVGGEGRPRIFFVRSYFFVDEIGSGAEYGFKTKLSGTTGEAFKPMIRIDDLEWFDDFMRSQGNFRRGF